MVLYSLIPIVLWGAALYVGYRRLYLSPISHIPVPKLAAVTRLSVHLHLLPLQHIQSLGSSLIPSSYEAYYDLWLGGQYTFKIIALHKENGPIIRISLWEIHVADPDFYEVVYASSASGHRRDKYDWFTKGFGLDNAVFATPGHDLHRLRRSALAPYFSMTSVRRLQPLLEERVNKLLERSEGFRDSGEVLNTSCAYAAFTNDSDCVIIDTEAPDFDPSYRDASYFGSTAGNYLKAFSSGYGLICSAKTSTYPTFLLDHAPPNSKLQEVLAHIQSITSGHNDSHQDLSHPTIFHTILDCKLPDLEKRDSRLSDDAQVLTMAGTLTTAWVFEVTTFHLLSNPSILSALKAELSTAIPSPNDIGAVPLPILESLPYLYAVMKKGFRLTYGVSCRLARSDPDNTIPFTDEVTGKAYIIPPGTPINMTSVQIYHDESLFPDSWTFRPERWLDPSSKALEKYLVSFTAGSRQCLGINLAYCELYLGLSAI
ncbi:Cyrochrome P450 monooxygenase [Lachnellula occidentalis]|uniref:Cyrochrome P450 monooxygenase n=1 Tax=Lachnellula occidentalis TaxID=215460 RepID=A0A8H8RZF8_9HELO|nr:Cyrochrome P450 monooxygenase [Lachnellula occidentalis]